MKHGIVAIGIVFYLTCLYSGVCSGVEVMLDTSAVPELAQWGQEAKTLVQAWHPRLCHLLAGRGHESPQTVQIILRKSNQGVAGTSGNCIRVSSGWIEQHPNDIGLVFHELVHVIQGYPSARPGWLVEGIADYLRWAIYEGKPQIWFPVPDEEKGYRQGYQICGGFLLWLESDRAPGIVKKLNAALRQGQYSSRIFKDETGLGLDELWRTYVEEHKHPSATV